MQITSVLDFAADNASFSFYDGDGTKWSGSCSQFCCRGNDIHVCGTVREGPKKWLEQKVSLIHSLSNATIIIN